MAHAIRRSQSVPHKPDEAELDEIALEESGTSFLVMPMASLPTHIVDERDPSACVAAEHLLRLAHDQVGSRKPFVTVQRSLRVTVMEDLPGSSFPLFFRRHGLYGFLAQVDA